MAGAPRGGSDGHLGHRRADVPVRLAGRRRAGDATTTSIEENALAVLAARAGCVLAGVHGPEHAVRRPRPEGFRPLVLGRLPSGWVVASETAALDIVGATLVREIDPGELIAIDERGVRSRRFAVAEAARLPVRVRLPGQARHLDQRTQRAGDKGRGRQAAGRRAPGRGRPRHSGAGVRDAGGDRLRPGQRDPLRPGPGQEQLRGQDVHPAEPDDQAARHQAEAQSAART